MLFKSSFYDYSKTPNSTDFCIINSILSDFGNPWYMCIYVDDSVLFSNSSIIEHIICSFSILSISHKKFSMRIGSKDSTSFNNPVSISKYDNELFICNKGSNKVRTINLKDYSVNDFRIFDEPVYKYLRSCGKEIVVLESGVYVL